MEESECRHELTIIEKKMVVRCYTFLDKYKKEDCFAGNRTRKLVELCIGVKKATVARVMQTYNENPEEVFQINKAPTMKSNRAEIMNWLAKHEDKYAAVAKARQDEEAKSLANTYVADDCSADSAQN
ncbi:hypothetical protein PC110_g7611 [Phytophthora cactorum]|uniref:Homeodomain-like n=1 Tax=Phytophthora cactorum TaxID=29920 RepID=A0A329SH27_9STRA|nr:hypothetical protein PC110_g7611 [Phytophthora cactorum]